MLYRSTRPTNGLPPRNLPLLVPNNSKGRRAPPHIDVQIAVPEPAKGWGGRDLRRDRSREASPGGLRHRWNYRTFTGHESTYFLLRNVATKRYRLIGTYTDR